MKTCRHAEYQLTDVISTELHWTVDCGGPVLVVLVARLTAKLLATTVTFTTMATVI